MANTPTREHREAAKEAWNQVVVGGSVECVAQAICDAEQRGYERGLKDAAAIASYGKHLAKEE